MHPLEDQKPPTLTTGQPSTIGVATDLTDLRRLIPHAIAQAKKGNSALCLIHALNIPDTMLLNPHGKANDESDTERAIANISVSSFFILRRSFRNAFV